MFGFGFTALRLRSLILRPGVARLLDGVTAALMLAIAGHMMAYAVR